VTTVAAFIAAAAVGALVRFVARDFNQPHKVPLGTLVPNLCGAFALGVVTSWSAPVATIVGAGFLGTLTTFSTLAGELAILPRRIAVLYGTVTIVGGVGAAWLGLSVA
jgi:CrcB protein